MFHVSLFLITLVDIYGSVLRGGVMILFVGLPVLMFDFLSRLIQSYRNEGEYCFSVSIMLRTWSRNPCNSDRNYCTNRLCKIKGYIYFDVSSGMSWKRDVASSLRWYMIVNLLTFLFLPHMKVKSLTIFFAVTLHIRGIRLKLLIRFARTNLLVFLSTCLTKVGVRS